MILGRFPGHGEGYFWGLKRGKNQVEGQGLIFGAFGVDFGPNFGDLLIQDEHVFTIILC